MILLLVHGYLLVRIGPEVVGLQRAGQHGGCPRRWRSGASGQVEAMDDLGRIIRIGSGGESCRLGQVAHRQVGG